MVKKAASRIYLAVIFLFLYLPILVLVVLSFNNSKSRVVWGGFTLKWYASCFTDKTIMNALIMTLQYHTLRRSTLHADRHTRCHRHQCDEKTWHHTDARCNQHPAVKRGYRDRNITHAAFCKIFKSGLCNGAHCTHYI